MGGVFSYGSTEKEEFNEKTKELLYKQGEKINLKQLSDIKISQSNNNIEEYDFDGNVYFRNLKHRELGSGAFGSVFVVQKDNHKYAMKVVKGGEILKTMSAEDATNSFLECPVVDRLNSNRIAKVYNYGLSGTDIYCVMELYKYGDLSDYYYDNYLVHNKIIESKTAFSIFYQVLEGLETLHENNIIHNDIKLENLLVSKLKPLNVVITDLGLWSYAEEGQLMIRKSGTILYVCPELIRREEHDPRKADLWASVVLYYQLLTGRIYESPFVNKNVFSDHELARSILENDVYFPNNVKILPEEKEFIMSILNEKHEANRPNVTEVLEGKFANMKYREYHLEELIGSRDRNKSQELEPTILDDFDLSNGEFRPLYNHMSPVRLEDYDLSDNNFKPMRKRMAPIKLDDFDLSDGDINPINKKMSPVKLEDYDL